MNYCNIKNLFKVLVLNFMLFLNVNAEWTKEQKRFYFNACVKQAGTNPTFCGCAIRQLNTLWDFEEFIELEENILLGEKVDEKEIKKLKSAILPCAVDNNKGLDF
jgi:muramoyltetrapeptide carboxypeptidase LdcA involved in peptidoglycan recycling